MYYKHNIEVYERFEPIILEYHECCLVSAMGTGKTDISMEFIKKYNLNTLVVLPTVDLCDHWKRIAEINKIYTLSAVTYHTFSRAFAALASGFDCYIFDEAHHMDSPIWGAAIRKLRNIIDDDKYVIGLTGSPIRYFDNCKNVIDTMFHGHVAYGISQYEAIMNGILPDVIYVCAIYDTEGLYKKYYNKATTEELRGRLSFAYENCRKINDILLNHALEHMKGFVFVDKIDSIQTGIDLVSKAFPDIPVRSAHSSMPKHEKYNNIEKFRNDNNGFMVSVNMFNEGHHVDGTNAVIMLRKTGSPTIYAQQIGRALSANYTGTAIIYDLVSNKESMKHINERINIITDMISTEDDVSSNMSNGKKDRKVSKQVMVYDYSKNLLEIIEEIDEAYVKVSWNKEEDQFLKENYNTKGVDFCAKQLGRTSISCQKRARRLGIVKSKADWTEDEDNILREFYPIMGRAVASKLPGRSERACTARANNYLGLVSRNNGEWTSSEINYLKNQYKIEGDKVKIPNRSNTECIGKLRQLGLLDKDNTKIWTDDEEKIIEEYYPILGCKVADMLPGRSSGAIKSKAHRSRLNKRSEWTDREDNIIKEHYPTLGCKIVDMLPGRTPGTIKTRASILGIKLIDTNINKYVKKRRWNIYEDNIIKEHYPRLGYKVADMLPGRSYAAIMRRAERLNVITLRREKAN